MNDAAQGVVVEDVSQDVAQDLGFGARVARALLAATAAAAAVFVQLALRWAQLGSSVAFAVLGAQLGSSVAFGSGCGQALPEVPRKAPLC